MRRSNGILPAIFALSLFASCSMNVADKPQTDTASLNDRKIAAAKQLESATAEFYDGLGTTEEGVALKNSIITEAWTAYYTGDAANITKLLKEKGLYEKYVMIMDKYAVTGKNELLAKHADGSNRAVTSSWFAGLADGDILLAYGGSSSGSGIGILIPGTWKHSGLYSATNRYGGDDEYRIASASNQTSHGFSAGWETRAKWTGESGVQSRKIRNVTSGAINDSFSYIMAQLGKPYKLSARNDESSWYCSKLIWKAFKNQGYDIEPPPAWYDAYVTPQDIHDDNDTYFVSGDLN
jgi:hypothetical protein